MEILKGSGWLSNGKIRVNSCIRRPTSGIQQSSESGLTLLEMLVSISMIAILLGVLSQVLWSGLQLWGKNHRAYQLQHQLKNIYQLFTYDLSNITTGPFLPDYAVAGNDYELTFWKETSSGLKQVKYQYDLGEKKLFRSVALWGENSQRYPVAESIEGWKFEYFEAKSKNWLLEWKPVGKAMVPALVRINAKYKQNNLAPVVVPIKVWHEEIPDDSL